MRSNIKFSNTYPLSNPAPGIVSRPASKNVEQCHVLSHRSNEKSLQTNNFCFFVCLSSAKSPFYHHLSGLSLVVCIWYSNDLISLVFDTVSLNIGFIIYHLPPSSFYPLSTGLLLVACIWYSKLQVQYCLYLIRQFYTVPLLLVFDTVTSISWASSVGLQHCQVVLPLSYAFLPCHIVLNPYLNSHII